MSIAKQKRVPWDYGIMVFIQKIAGENIVASVLQYEIDSLQEIIALAWSLNDNDFEDS